MDTMRERFAAVTSRLLDEDDRLAVLLADISTDYFLAARRRHPDRVVNVGIREQLLVSAAGGMALTGLRPVVHTIAPFLVARPYEQIKLDLAHQGAGAVLVSGGGSYDYAPSGRTHHAPEDVALLDTIPGWTVHVPGHPDELEVLLTSALRGDGLVYVRMSDRSNAQAMSVGSVAPDVVRRGTRGTVVAVGPMLDRTLQAVEGRDVTVLYATTIRPFDRATLLGTLTRPDVVLVEPYLRGTSSWTVSDALADVPHRLLSLGVRREEVRTYGTPEDHDQLHGLDAAGIRRSVDGFLQ